MSTWIVSGEHVTMQQIMQRLRVSEGTAKYRLRRAQKQPGAVTWAALAADGRSTRPAPKSHPWRCNPSCESSLDLPAPEPGRRYAQFGRGGRGR